MSEYLVELEEIFISNEDLLNCYDYCDDEDLKHDDEEKGKGIKFRGYKIAWASHPLDDCKFAKSDFIYYKLYQLESGGFIGIKMFKDRDIHKVPNYIIEKAAEKKDLKDFFEYDEDNEEIEQEEIMRDWFCFNEPTIEALRKEEELADQLAESLTAAKHVIEYLTNGLLEDYSNE